MIVDYIERSGQYSRNIPKIYEVVKFAEKVKKENIPVGKYPITNGFILVQDGTTRPFEEGDYISGKRSLRITYLPRAAK